MNTENTTTTTNPYLSLKPRQQLFVRYIAEWYDAPEDEGVLEVGQTYNRGVLRTIAQKAGIEWAPAWIVKDTSRVRGRGEYVVPEVHWYMSMALEEEDAADRILSGADAQYEPSVIEGHPVSEKVLTETA